MRKKRIPTALIAILVVAIAVTSVFAYYETWSGFFWSNGTLTYDGDDYTFSSDTGYLCDSTKTANDSDYFYMRQDGVTLPFACSRTNDTIFLTITKSGTGGAKATGQSGKKPASGTWAGSAYVKSDAKRYTVSGTWESTGDDFDYTATPWDWEGEATITSCTPTDDIEGDGNGGSDIECTSNSSPCGSCQ